MNIKEKFLSLTDRTYPHGTERDLFHLLSNDLLEDEFGNLVIKIGESDVMFTSHLDTATQANTKVNHIFEDVYIKTDGKSILGADDKAGVTIMLNMIENKIPGLYYFFLGEEVGCVGSRKVANIQKDKKIEGINKVISFDRKGTNSVITFQSSQRCCSDNFGNALSNELNKHDITFDYKNDDTGILTDSIQFTGIYSECTNISVGYYNEHTKSEKQDIEHLIKLAEVCLKVDWNSLPVERDPSTVEYKSYTSRWCDGDYETLILPSYKKLELEEDVWFYDEKYGYVSTIKIKKQSKKVIRVDLHTDRIDEEYEKILDMLSSIELSYKFCLWDGLKLKVYYDNDHQTECSRDDIIEFLPELDYSDGYDLKGDNTNDSFTEYYKRLDNYEDWID